MHSSMHMQHLCPHDIYGHLFQMMKGYTNHSSETRYIKVETLGKGLNQSERWRQPEVNIVKTHIQVVKICNYNVHIAAICEGYQMRNTTKV